MIYSKFEYPECISDRIECNGDHWTWTGSVCGKSPVLWKNSTRKRIPVRRFMYETTFDKKTEFFVKNDCGNNLCIYPDHLYEQTPYNRFVRFIDYPENDNDCWIWNGDLTEDKRARFWITTKKPIAAARWIYQHVYGEVDKDVQVRRSCGHRLCVNIDHLYIHG